MKNSIKKLVFTALIAALACVATLVLHIPSPLGGYINLGDCIALTGGWLLGPLYGFLAAGIGSALADIFLGYFIYAPATFVIKGLVAVIACLLLKSIGKIKNKSITYIISGTIAEIFMITGYYIFEGFMYGFAESLVNIPPNAVQGIVGIAAGTVLTTFLVKSRVSELLK